ncbi:alpha/beta hydrolase-fold protein [Flavobacterium azooxidireducens]|uniref:Alpha/beta hydrolase-fold protein n=1 Tax=Flavobacterium azooxidireducens TaxID=1871076 RepID=A0ABY4KFF6_9FLAO|nr:alpha/beta hydrolase-fold protein [Flavobacterium azooxidireducens]UPQ79531.1 alpha/beta hydrolase-fold protein [Flavobacterium azooxidireducens]
MKKFLLLFISIFSFTFYGQVTLRITSIPGNTPSEATIYLAGSVNGWNPVDNNSIMQPDGFGAYQLVIPEGTGTVEYKFTRGSWATVEGNASGGFLPNRTFSFTGSPQTLTLTIQSWEDLGGVNNSTAAANVQILSSNFYMPQLDRNRRIWLYLPPDYQTSTKNYPVLYMKDGQNLFDNLTSFAGEWEVDETLNTLFNQGDYGAIVVGIDNGLGERQNEYSPWVNAQYGGGQGDEYMEFIAETLKPYIDENFRTRTEPQFNALIGSSLGGLIATYGVCEYPNLFRKLGSFSPAYWFALDDLNSYLNSPIDLSNHRSYFVAGQNESSTMVTNTNTIKNAMQNNGMSSDNTLTKFDSYGTHTESYWRGEFGAAYQWLFMDENLSVETISTIKPTIIQTLSGKLWLEGFEDNTTFELFAVTGQKVTALQLENGMNSLPDNLKSGIYILKSEINTIKVILN